MRLSGEEKEASVRLQFDYDIRSLSYILCLARIQDGGCEVAKLEWVEVDHKTGVPPEAHPKLSEGQFKEWAQRLIDDLWKVGIRPTDAGSVNGELQATKDALTRERDLMDRTLTAALRAVAK